MFYYPHNHQAYSKVNLKKGDFISDNPSPSSSRPSKTAKSVSLVEDDDDVLSSRSSHLTGVRRASALPLTTSGDRAASPQSEQTDPAPTSWRPSPPQNPNIHRSERAMKKHVSRGWGSTHERTCNGDRGKRRNGMAARRSSDLARPEQEAATRLVPIPKSPALVSDQSDASPQHEHHVVL